jgi:hypothetical protein
MLSQLDLMTIDEKWKLIDSEAKPSRPHPSISKCKPNWISGLYCNIPFPHYTFKDGTSIQLSENNIYNGTLNEEDSTDKVAMQWEGYTCQLYDGTLKMCPVENNSTIVGVCNGVHFKFEGGNLITGVWPGFLDLYVSS